MEDRELIEGQYTNNATLASKVLVLLGRLRIDPDFTLSQGHRRSLSSLSDFLSGSANGAKSKTLGSDLSPAGDRSLSDDLISYDIATNAKRGVEPKDLEEWTRRAAKVVGRLEASGFHELSDDEKRWIATELEPFLDELVEADAAVDDDGVEIPSHEIAA